MARFGAFREQPHPQRASVRGLEVAPAGLQEDGHALHLELKDPRQLGFRRRHVRLSLLPPSEVDERLDPPRPVH